VRELLAKVDSGLLKNEVVSLPLAAEHSCISGMSSAKDLASFLVSYYGHELLESASLRHALFTLLPLSVLNTLCESEGLPQSKFPHDAALILSTAPWTYSSSLPSKISTELKKAYGKPIPADLLPSEAAPKPPTLEEFSAGHLPPLFGYQQEMSDAVLNLLAAPGSKGLLQMPTGSGKTRTAMHAIVRWLSQAETPARPVVLWLAHAEELCEQASASFKASWAAYGAGLARLARFWGNHRLNVDQVSKGVILASLQKLHSLRVRDQSLFKDVVAKIGVLAFDEAHKALAPTYRDLISAVQKANPAVVLLGLSATPGRAVLEAIQNERLSLLFGNKLLAPNFGGVDAITALRNLGVLAHVKRKVIWNPQQYELRKVERDYLFDFFDFPPSFVERVGLDEKRNLAIVSSVIDQARQGNQCIVFACGVAHAKLLSALVGLRGVESCCVTGDMRHATRLRAIDGFRRGAFKVLTNFGILSTGFDVPSVGAVVIARPTSSVVLYSQMIGRGLRGPKVGGKAECLVIDVIDNIEGFGTDAEIYNYFADYWD